MDVVHERAAGMDISKRDAKVALRVPGKRAGTFTTNVTTWGSTVRQILELIEFLDAQRVTTVVMEATSDYWKPYYFLMEDRLPVMLVNAKQARNIPGRKTDVSDSVWLAQLAAHGLLRPSFVPPEPIRQLQNLGYTSASLRPLPEPAPYSRISRLCPASASLTGCPPGRIAATEAVPASWPLNTDPRLRLLRQAGKGSGSTIQGDPSLHGSGVRVRAACSTSRSTNGCQDRLESPAGDHLSADWGLHSLFPPSGPAFNRVSRSSPKV
ncbi:MAG TPA: transposase [Sinomonas sp.]|nr:transposase [Sinomonas sp.]